jgi:hypothetical protein
VIATFTTSSDVFSNAHVQGEIIGNVSGRARIVAVTAPTSATAEITQAFPLSTTSLLQGAWKVRESLFALVYNLVAPERLHLLGPDPTNPLKTNEWVDNFVSLRPSQTLTISDSSTDRTVNSNRLYGPGQKGVRVMEARNISSPSVLGWSFGVASPNEAGDVVALTQSVDVDEATPHLERTDGRVILVLDPHLRPELRRQQRPRVLRRRRHVGVHDRLGAVEVVQCEHHTLLTSNRWVVAGPPRRTR